MTNSNSYENKRKYGGEENMSINKENNIKHSKKKRTITIVKLCDNCNIIDNR